MPVPLIFLFFFQSGLAFVFSFFIARILINGSQDTARIGLLHRMAKIRNGILAFAIILPPLIYFAYYKSLPDGKPASLAAWPAVWILMILIAVVLALTLSIWRARSKLQ